MKTIPLKHPFSFAGTEYAHVTLRRVRGKNMKVIARHMEAFERLAGAGKTDGADALAAVDEETITALIEIVASMADLPAEVADEMDFEDLSEIAGSLGDFFPQSVPASPRSGAAS